VPRRARQVFGTAMDTKEPAFPNRRRLFAFAFEVLNELNDCDDHNRSRLESLFECLVHCAIHLLSLSFRITARFLISTLASHSVAVRPPVPPSSVTKSPGVILMLVSARVSRGLERNETGVF
jgi:hypothetical protein